jgi:O-antigen/teichoic acid export membrane protein
MAETIDNPVRSRRETFASSRIVSHLRHPLFQNGYALIASSGTSAALGFLFWILAARFYTTQIVGLNSALISAMLFLSGVSQLSLNSVLIRFVPQAGTATRRLVIYSYLACTVVAAVIGLFFTLRLTVWEPALAQINPGASWQLFFILATMLWCIFTLQDSVLAGLRQALWVPLENTVFAVVKLVLVIGLAGSMQSSGIFLAWNIAVLVVLLPVNWLIFKRLIPRHVRNTEGRTVRLSPRVIGKFAGGNYLGNLFFLASTALLPVMVTALAGPRANAYFYPPWMIVTSLQLIALNMAISFTVEATLDQTQLNHYGWRILVQTARLVVPLVIIIFVCAPLILQLFGSAYAEEGTALLRWLLLGALPNIVTAWFIGMSRVRNHPRSIVLVQGSFSVLMLSLSFLLLTRMGITGIGLAWFISQTVIAAALLPSLLNTIRHARRHAHQLHTIPSTEN